jgi:hypothetical protein
MKYSLENHHDDIRVELQALMLELGQDPEGIDGFSYVDLRTAALNAYPVFESINFDNPATESLTSFTNHMKKVKAVLKGRKLIYMYKLTKWRIQNG